MTETHLLTLIEVADPLRYVGKDRERSVRRLFDRHGVSMLRRDRNTYLVTEHTPITVWQISGGEPGRSTPRLWLIQSRKDALGAFDILARPVGGYAFAGRRGCSPQDENVSGTCVDVGHAHWLTPEETGEIANWIAIRAHNADDSGRGLKLANNYAQLASAIL